MEKHIKSGATVHEFLDCPQIFWTVYKNIYIHIIILSTQNMKYLSKNCPKLSKKDFPGYQTVHNCPKHSFLKVFHSKRHFIGFWTTQNYPKLSKTLVWSIFPLKTQKNEKKIKNCPKNIENFKLFLEQKKNVFTIILVNCPLKSVFFVFFWLSITVQNASFDILSTQNFFIFFVFFRKMSFFQFPEIKNFIFFWK